MVAVAVAVGGGQVCATAFVDVPGAVANAAGVEFSDATVHVVADAVSVLVGVTRAPTNAQGIDLVAVAIAVALGQGITTAFVHHARTVAHTAGVQRTHTIVHVVAHAVGIEVFCAIAATLTHGVGLVSVAIAVAHGDKGASARVNGARAVADPTSVKGADAWIFVVADAVKVHVEVAPASAHPNGVFLASKAIAFAFLDVVAAAFEHWARTVAHPARVQGSDAVVFVVADAVVVHVGQAIAATFAKHVKDISVAVARAVLDFVATAFENGARTVALAAFVQFPHARIHIVADAVAVGVRNASAATHPQGIVDVAVAVAFAVLDFVATAFEDGAGTVALAAFVQCSDAVVHVVADAVVVCVRKAGAATHPQGVYSVAFTIACALCEGTAATLVHGARPVADATSVKGADAVVHVVAHAVAILIGFACSATCAEGVQLVPAAVAVPVGDVNAATRVHGPGAVADAADVKRPDALVHVVADAVLIDICLAIAPAVACRIGQVAFAPAVKQVEVWRDATAVVFRGGRVEIASLWIGAPSVHAPSVVGVGVGVEIRGVLVKASANHVGVEGHVKTQVVLVVSLRKDLDTHGTAEVAVRGELGQQHALCRACDGVGGGPGNHGPARSVFTLFHKPSS